MEAQGIEPWSGNAPERRLREYFVIWRFAQSCAHKQALLVASFTKSRLYAVKHS